MMLTYLGLMLVGAVAGSAVTLMVSRRRQSAPVSLAPVVDDAVLAAQIDWDAVIEQLPVVLFIKDATNGRYVRVNRAQAAVTGLSAAEMVGRTDAEIWPDHDVSFRISDAEVLAADGVVDIPEQRLDSDLGTRWLHTRKVRLDDREGKPQFVLGISEDITERKAMQHALEHERGFLRTLLDNMPDMVFVKDTDLRYKLVNQAFAAHFDLAPAAIIGCCDEDLLSPDLVAAEYAGDRQVIDAGATLHLSVQRQDLCGNISHFDVFKVPLTAADGAITGLLGVGHDVSEKQRAADERRLLLEQLADARIARAQAEMAAAEDHARQVLQAVNEAILGMDYDGNVTFFNRAAEQLFGYAERDVMGSNLHDLIHHTRPDGSPFPASECQTMLAVHRGETRDDITQVYWRRDGSQFTAGFSLIPMRDGESVTGAVMVVRDITAREANDARLRMLSRAVEESPALVTLTDTDGVIVFVNQRFTEVTGFSADELIGYTHRKIASGLTAEATYRDLWQTVSSGRRWRGELQNRRRDGGLFWHSLTITPFKDDSGRITHYLALGEDVTARRQLEKMEREAREVTENLLYELGRQEERLRLITDNVPAMISFFDTEQRLVYCNRGYAELFGFDRQQAIGRSLRDLVGDVFAETDDVRNRAMAGETVRYQTVRSGRTIDVTMLPARRDDAEIFGVYALLVDITDKQREADALSAALAAAEAANVAKSEFLANIGHEIRTPMNAIIGLTTLAMRACQTSDGVTGQQHEYLVKTQRSARMLLTLLNEILDFSKIEAGKLCIDPHPFSLLEVLDALNDLFSCEAAEKGLAFTIKVASGVPDVLVGDGLRLKQILTNLCSNALKFTDVGQVAVAVSSEAQPDDGVQLRLAVSDTGVGMQDAQLDRVFDAFIQADGSTTRRYGGTGLGLTISRRLAELMHGRIEAASRPGQGSCFTVLIPMQLAHPVAGTEAPATVDQASALKGARVLLVDDYVLNQEIVLAYLVDSGCDVTLAGDGQEALAKLEQGRFDAVLMDCQMPVMDGYEAARQIRLQTRWADLPVIAMTANVMAGDRERCLAAGMNDFIAKPVELDHLLAILASWLARRVPHEVKAPAPMPITQAAAVPVVPVVAASQAVPAGMAPDAADLLTGIDLEAALHSTMGKPDFLRRVLAVFHKSQSQFAELFAEARREGDGELSARLAHTLKGGAASIGAFALRDAALALEQACKQQQDAAAVDALSTAVLEQLAPVLAGISNYLAAPAR